MWLLDLVAGPVTVREPATEAERQEVAKWIEERKRNYPSAANVQKKDEAAKVREAAGGLDPKVRGWRVFSLGFPGFLGPGTLLTRHLLELLSWEL